MIRIDINHPNPVSVHLHCSLQAFHGYSLIIDFHRCQGSFMGPEGINGSQIGGIFKKNHISLVDEHHAAHVQPLLGSAGDDDFFKIIMQIKFFCKTVSDDFPESYEAAGGTIAQGLFPRFLHHMVKGFPDGFQWVGFRRGKTCRKGNHVRCLNDLKGIEQGFVGQSFNSGCVSHINPPSY